MRKSILFGLSLSLITGLAIGLLWLSKGNTTQAESTENLPHPFEVLNQKAKNARTGDLSAAKELVGETMSLTGFEDKLRGSTADMIKRRVGQAESRYHQGQSAGIPEGRVARTINGLAIKLKLPDFARTNVYEVRKLRLSLIPSFPQFISQKAQSGQPVQAGAKLDSQMSPAEAVFVTEMLIQQKLANEEYQVTHAERLKDWKEKHNHHPNRGNSQSPAKDRSREMRDALNRGADSMSLFDTMQLATVILNTLGIEQ